MLELGSWTEILIISVAALVLLGPKEIPQILRTLGRLLQKFRRLSHDIRQVFDQYIKEGEFEEFKKTANIYEPLNDDAYLAAPKKNLATKKRANAKKNSYER